MAIFNGRTRVRYGYSCYGFTRGGGKTWHGGSDEEGLDSDRIVMPGYQGKSISGTVTRARKVDKSTGDPTWEWGNYVCVQLDANQTPDAVNYLYFCHNAQNLVAVGQKVKTGDVLAVMGNTGNAAAANPPFAHCHFEVRATATGRGLDPAAYTGHPNAAGTYGTTPAGQAAQFAATVLVDGLRLRPYPTASDDNANEAIATLEKGKSYPLRQTRDGWAFLMMENGAGGWVCMGENGAAYLDVEEV